jgi:hypothetical protein
MPKTTRDEGPPVEPPPAGAQDELDVLSLTPLPAAHHGREADAVHEGGQYLDDRSEAELLGLMSMQRLEPDAARDAWAEMYRRHSRYVASVVARAFPQRARDADTLSDIVSDAFRTVFDWAGRHRSGEALAERFAATDRDGVRRKVLGFHAVVARRLAMRRFAVQGRGPREFTHGDIEQVASATEEDYEPPPATKVSKLEALLELLSSDEAEALRVSLPWYQPETGEFSFPRGEAARVAESLGITPEALRQRRSRSLKRLQSLLGAK